MIKFVFIDPDGYPTRFGAHPTALPDGAIAVGANEDVAAYLTRRWTDGAWAARPVLPGPQVEGNHLWFDGLPDAAVIHIADAITGDAVPIPPAWAGAVEVTLQQGSYLVRITAPNPWLDHESLIDVAGGSAQRALDALANAKRAARARINEAAGRARLALVTDIPGQTAIYQAKETEARAYLALPSEPETLADFPLIAAEVGITAQTPYQLAQIWVGMAHLFKLAAAASEQARLATLAAVDAATSIAALEAIFNPNPEGEP